MKGGTTVTPRGVVRRLAVLSAWGVLSWLMASFWATWALVPGKDPDPTIVVIGAIAGVFAIVCALAAVTVAVVRWVTRGD